MKEDTMKPRTKEEYVQIDQLTWKPFPEPFSQGGIRWKLLHVSPEVGAWTAIFDCPAGSSLRDVASIAEEFIAAIGGAAAWVGLCRGRSSGR
jgi:hypothetical protein